MSGVHWMQFIAKCRIENGLLSVTLEILNPLHRLYTKRSCKFLQSYIKFQNLTNYLSNIFHILIVFHDHGDWLFWFERSEGSGASPRDRLAVGWFLMWQLADFWCGSWLNSRMAVGHSVLSVRDVRLASFLLYHRQELSIGMEERNCIGISWNSRIFVYQRGRSSLPLRMVILTSPDLGFTSRCWYVQNLQS